MADAYGTTISNTIQAKDAESAQKIKELLESVVWSEDTKFEVAGTTVYFGGAGQYPHAYPEQKMDEAAEDTGEIEEADPAIFEQIRQLLEPGTSFVVTAVASEKLRSNYCERLIVQHGRPNEYGFQVIGSYDAEAPITWATTS